MLAYLNVYQAFVENNKDKSWYVREALTSGLFLRVWALLGNVKNRGKVVDIMLLSFFIFLSPLSTHICQRVVDAPSYRCHKYFLNYRCLVRALEIREQLARLLKYV